ncbi:MAG: RNA pseudouridine synthase [Deltaproteobacteria bacterium]|jgi:RluA family pseudouridine synthase|nr:RNA pseudouridine synthase [Deltaproteobacteria bacterium]MBT4526454.1 RNA pseudouridine synthase [Deltaproteobacteria bacterium]
MTPNQKKIKSPPKRFQPRGLSILYEDRDILVVDKISGLLTISTAKVRENTAYFLLNTYVRKGNQKSRNRIFIVHRLDKDTSGIIIFAKNEANKRYLQDEWQNFNKKYYVVIQGTMKAKEGIITSYLAENRMHKMYSVTDPQKGKLARTRYKVLRESKKFSLLEIELLTGRKNQIRVHFSENDTPVAGDKMYGKIDKRIKRLTLHAASLTILHPDTKEKMVFNTEIPAYFNILLNA